jgi:hypothetical protein
VESNAPMHRAVLAALLVVTLAGCGDDTNGSRPATTSTTTSSSVTTAVPTTVPAGDDLATAVWPDPSHSQRFDDPVAAARSFAVDLVGFTDPVVGEFRQGDARSGEVEVRPTPTGPVTTVLVRQLGGDDTWWVLGSTTTNIEVDQPTAGEQVSSPVRLAGRANAYEGNVNVQIVTDGSTEPLVESYVTGMMGELGPFDREVEFPNPGSGRGAVLFRTFSEEDGSVWEAAVVRVSFVTNG